MAAYKYSVVFCTATKHIAGGLGWMPLCKEGQSNVPYSEDKPWQEGQKGSLSSLEVQHRNLASACKILLCNGSSSQSH